MGDHSRRSNEMRPYGEADLGREGAEYERQCLLNVKDRGFASLLLAQVDLLGGSAAAFVPVGTNKETLVEFRGFLGDIRLAYTREHLAKRISMYLQSRRGGLCIFDSVYASPSDPWLTRSMESEPDRTWKFLGKEVYEVSINAQLNNVYKWVLDANHGYLSFGMLTSVLDAVKWKTTSEISLSDLEAPVRNVEHIILNAYDDEGFVIWSRKDEPSRETLPR